MYFDIFIYYTLNFFISFHYYYQAILLVLKIQSKDFLTLTTYHCPSYQVINFLGQNEIIYHYYSEKLTFQNYNWKILNLQKQKKLLIIIVNFIFYAICLFASIIIKIDSSLTILVHVLNLFTSILNLFISTILDFFLTLILFLLVTFSQKYI